MHQLSSIFKRELAGYFLTPIAYVFIIIFLVLAGVFTFYLGGFFERGQADLTAFFAFHPWLYLFLVPALSMRLWAEERKSGTIELLLTLPVTTTQVVVAKALAAWVFLIVALALTFPLWITVNILGDPDNGVIAASYVGSALMAGAFVSIGACFSALTKNQVIAFILSLVVCLLLNLGGFPLVLDFFSGWVPEVILRTLASMSFLTHFEAISRGVIDLRDVVFFISLLVFFLFANVLLVELKKAG
jgi:ABC-2 type transport system permease protein